MLVFLLQDGDYRLCPVRVNPNDLRTPTFQVGGSLSELAAGKHDSCFPKDREHVGHEPSCRSCDHVMVVVGKHFTYLCLLLTS